MNHKEALQEIVTICSDNESSIDLVHRIEMIAEKALRTEAVVVSAALDKQWRVEWDEAPDEPPAPTEEELQMAALHNAGLTGVIIGCCGKKGECTNYSVVEDFPDDAGKIFYERGWRMDGLEAFCPDCVRDNKRKAKQ